MKLALLLLSIALTTTEQRGRHVYRNGASTVDGVPAGALPCISCHGPEGRGVAEGTIVPADIRNAVLARYLVNGERRRPRYDDALLTRAIRTGHDAGGNELSSIMPRYRISDSDLSDLLAYLHRLGDEPQPGLHDEELTIASVLPLSGPYAATGERTRAVLEAYFAEINAQGGVHGRTLKLRAIDSTKAPAKELGGDVFAVVNASLAGAGEGVPAVVDEERIPLVTPLPFDSAQRVAPSSFFLFSDLESQALALARHAGSGPRNVFIVHSNTPAARAAAEALEEKAAAMQWKVNPAAKRDDDLLFLIGTDPEAVLRKLAAAHWKPRLFIAGTALRALPEYGNEVALAVPTLPTDWSAEGAQELHALAERHQLPSEHLAAQIAPYAAAKVLVEALKRAGRDLTREKLIATLEGFYQFQTGLTQPLSYTRGRHIGASGAFILPAGEWTRGD